MKTHRYILAAAVAAIAFASAATAQEKSVVVASTTSTQDSGLFNHILPIFKAKTGIDVRVIAQGTGQALDTARRGDADVVFVHAKAQEEKFVADGFGMKRFDVMYNDFVLIGPKSDPAKIKGGKDVAAALTAISGAASPFVSRGDKSGTHAAELALWKAANLDPAGAKPAWYREIGQGMGAALNTAGAMGAYVLSDRGTWISFKNKGELEISSTGLSPRRGRARSAPTRSTASNCSFPMPRPPASESFAGSRARRGIYARPDPSIGSENRCALRCSRGC